MISLVNFIKYQKKKKKEISREKERKKETHLPYHPAIPYPKRKEGTSTQRY